jgi:putative flippase GtrA
MNWNDLINATKNIFNKGSEGIRAFCLALNFVTADRKAASNSLLNINSNSISSQFFKYSIVGFINLGLSTLLFLLLYKVFHIIYFITFILTWLFGILVTYVINFIWVFKPEEKLEFIRRLPKYVLVYVISFVINLILLRYLVEAYQFDAFLVQLFILPLVVLINFFGFKYWALK